MTATKNFRVESFVSGLAIKAPCLVNSIANLTLSGEQTVNGLALVVGDRVLVMAQTDPIENGIYNVETSAWQRSGDFDGNRDVTERTQVVAGSAAGGRSVTYECTSALPITIGVSAIIFATPTTVVSNGSSDFEINWNPGGWMELNITPDAFYGWYMKGVGELAIYDVSGDPGSDPPVPSDSPVCWFSLWNNQDWKIGEIGFDTVGAAVFSFLSFVYDGKMEFVCSNQSGGEQKFMEYDPLPEVLVFRPGNVEGARVTNPTSLSAGETSFWLYDDDNGTVEQVTVGAADSGGAGFKVLRIPN